jgi:hypothetical protein
VLLTHYVVLRPSLETTLDRAKSRAGDERVPGHPALTDEEPIRIMWHAFAQLGDYESNVIDTSDLTVADTVDRVWSKFADRSALM